MYTNVEVYWTFVTGIATFLLFVVPFLILRRIVIALSEE